MASSYLSPGVYVEEVSSGSKPIEGVGTAVAAFVGFTEKGPANDPDAGHELDAVHARRSATSSTARTSRTPCTATSSTAAAPRYVVRVGGDGNGAGPSAPSRELPAAGDEGTPGVHRARRRRRPRPGDDLTVEIGDRREAGRTTCSSCVVKRGGKVEETFDNVTTRRGPTNVATVVRQQSKLIRLEEIRGRRASPCRARARWRSRRPAPPRRRSRHPGDYVGNSADRTGFAGLEAIDEVTMLCVPDLMAALPARH